MYMRASNVTIRRRILGGHVTNFKAVAA
jgi:hypothetical protein